MGFCCLFDNSFTFRGAPLRCLFGYTYQTATPIMQPGQKMTGKELQQAARDAMEGHTQQEVADRLGVSRGTVAAALNGKSPDRYQKPLSEIVEAFTDYSVERQVRYAVKEKA